MSRRAGSGAAPPTADGHPSVATIVLIAAGGQVPPWLPRTPDVPDVALVKADADEDELREPLERACGVVVDSAAGAPLSMARKVHRLAPAAQLVIVADAAQHPDLNRTMLFTPGVGEVWLMEPREVTPDLLERAVKVGSQRRQHVERSRSLASQVSSLDRSGGRRRIVADHYLAVLLELLPEPVLALAEDDSLLFHNPAASDVLGIGGERLDGAELRKMLAPTHPKLLDRLLEQGRSTTARAELRLRGEREARFFDVAVAPVGGESGVRALVFHDMTDQVLAREQLEDLTMELELQKEELESQRDELERQKLELSEALQHRSRFYASMSHELRTPINAIMGYGDLLTSDVFGSLPDQQRNALERIHSAANHLRELIDDVLDLSKLEAGKIKIIPEPIDVEEIIMDLRATMGPLAEEVGAELRFDTTQACDDPFVTDPRRVRQILLNLLSNAIRYGEASPVEISCDVRGERLRVEVQDRGPGIPADKQDEIFDEFVQVGPTENGGTGLGLPIARSLARALGGELGVSSEEGKGSLFWVELPSLRSAEP